MNHDSPIALLADDLTGALDCAAAFAVDGNTPFVSIRGEVITPDDCGVISINADTRRLSEDDAEQIVLQTVARLGDSPATLRYVKIDSTLRGHPAVEIAAAAEATAAPLVIVAPSFPATGRTVRRGQLLVHGVPLDETEVGRDPLSPIETSRVSGIFGRDTNAAIALIRLEVVRSGQLADGLAPIVASAGDTPVFAICDAETDGDLDSLVAAGRTLEESSHMQGQSILFAGSAGLASALARAVQADANYNAKTLIPTVRPPILIVTASQRSLADDQITALTEAHLAERHVIDFEIDATGGIKGVSFSEPAIASALAARHNVVLRATVDADLTAFPPAVVRSTADAVTQRLGEIVTGLTEKQVPGALVVIGGETAFGILSAAEARGIFLAAEPLPGVPVGTISGGPLDNVPIATKAGAFGHDRTLVQLVQHLTASRPTNGNQP